MIAESAFFIPSLLISISMSATPADPPRVTSLYDVRNAVAQNAAKTGFDFGPRSGTIRYDARMLRAAEIAAQRARGKSVSRCWRYVKSALLEAKVVDSYPGTAYAKQAGDELSQAYGFKKLPIASPFKAPVGAILVYGGKGPGHVEIRTRNGFVSDFKSDTPSPRPLIGVYVKPVGKSRRPSPLPAG
jgi:hypothetical protein